METAIFGWRALHSVSVNPPVKAGLAPTMTEAKRQAEAAMSDPRAALAMIVPIGLCDGVFYTEPSIIGLRTRDGSIKWRDPSSGEWSRTPDPNKTASPVKEN